MAQRLAVIAALSEDAPHLPLVPVPTSSSDSQLLVTPAPGSPISSYSHGGQINSYAHIPTQIGMSAYNFKAKY